MALTALAATTALVIAMNVAVVVGGNDGHVAGLARAVWCARALGMQAEGSAADRHVYRGIAWLHVREVISRTKAVVDITTRRTPRHAGPGIDLAGDGRVTAG